MTTTHRRPHRLTRIALVTAVAIFFAGGCFSWGDYSSGSSYGGSANYSLEDQLFAASLRGDVALVEDLFDRGADIEARDDLGNTALINASWMGQLAVVELLLDRGADIEARNDLGRTALIEVSWLDPEQVQSNLYDRSDGFTDGLTMELLYSDPARIYIKPYNSNMGQLAVVELPLHRGADTEPWTRDGNTAFIEGAYWAGELAVVELLLDRGADIDARTNSGWTALMGASNMGQLAVVELFLNRGADIDARTDSGTTALMLASKKGNDKVVAMLRAWAAEPGGRQDTRPTLVQSQEPAPAAQAPRPGTPPPVEQNKTALLIANAGYDHFPKLRTPLQEARQLGAALKRIGFEVEVLTDGSQSEMREALYRFEERVRERGGTALFHYGGHGVQVNGVNYLLPVDQNIPDERRVRSLAISADEISGALQAARSTANIVILDACRDNPLPRETRSTDVRGLAPVNNPPPNTLIVFAAGGGEVARDGLFTPALLRYIEQPGIEITDMLRRVRRDVQEASDGKQMPANYDQLLTEVYLAGSAR